MLLLPALVTTQVLCAPIVTPEEMLKVAVICVGLTTTILVCESPFPCSLTCEPVVKFVPVSVTFTDVPLAPLAGTTEVSVGRPLATFTVKAAVLLVPPVVVTEML